MVNSANPLTSSSQSEEPRNLNKVRNRQYILQKKLKARVMDLRESSDGSAFTLSLACISLISIMVATFKEAVLNFACGLAKTYLTC